MSRGTGSKNKATVERLNAVEAMLLDHFNEAQVIHVMGKETGLAEKTVRGYIRQVRQRWLDEAEKARPSRKAAAVARLHNVGRKAKSMPAVLVQVEKQIAEIEGTKAPEKVEQTTISLDAQGDKAIQMIANALGLDPEDIIDGN